MSRLLSRLFVFLITFSLALNPAAAYAARMPAPQRLPRQSDRLTSEAFAAPALEVRIPITQNPEGRLRVLEWTFWQFNEWTASHQFWRTPPSTRLRQYRREHRVVEIRPDDRHGLVGYLLSTDGRYFIGRVDLSMFFEEEPLQKLQTRLMRVRNKPWVRALRVLLGADKLVYQTSSALYVAENWLHGYVLPERFLHAWKPPKSGMANRTESLGENIEDHEIDYDMSNQYARDEGRRQGIPRHMERPYQTLPDPLWPEGLLYRYETTLGRLSSIGHLPERQPKLSEILGIEFWEERSGFYLFQYPQEHGMRLRLSHRSGLYGTVWSVPGDGHATHEAIAEHWDEEGSVPLQALGGMHFHDVSDHLTGYIVLFTLKKVVSLSRAQARFIRGLLMDPRVYDRPNLRRFLVGKRTQFITAMDRLSSIFNFLALWSLGQGSRKNDEAADTLSNMTFEGRSVPDLAEHWLDAIALPLPLQKAIRSKAGRLAGVQGMTPAELIAARDQALREIERGFPSIGLQRRPRQAA